MDPFSLFCGASLIVSGSVGLGWVVGHHQRRRWRALVSAWRGVAEVHGLSLGAGRSEGLLAIRGKIGAIEISVEMLPHNATVSGAVSPGVPRTRFEVGAPDIPANLVMTPGQPSGLLGSGAAGDLELGDTSFDPYVNLFGDELRAVALLGENTRERAWYAVYRFGASLREQRLVYEEGDWIRTPERLERLIKMFVQLAQRLQLDEEQIPKMLHKNASAERCFEVRRRNLRLLVEVYPQTPEAKSAIETCLESEQPEVRVFGTRGMEPAEALSFLCDIVRDSQIEQETRNYAAYRLVTSLRSKKVDEVMLEIFARKKDPTKVALVRGVGLTKDLHLYRLIIANLEHLKSDTQASLEVVRALARGGFDFVEPALIELLAHLSSEVKILAADALAVHGSIACVAPLMIMQRSLFVGTMVRDAARAAIQQVQARATRGVAGGLSIVKPEGEGALSVAHQAQGGLSESTGS